MLKRALIIISSILILLFLLPTLVIANGVAVDPMEPTSWAPIMYFINLPINMFVYIVMLIITIVFKMNKDYFIETPTIFFLKIIAVGMIVTCAGVGIDALVITMITSDSNVAQNYTYIFYGLILIFASYYLSIMIVQALDSNSAFMISLGVTIFNLTAWHVLLVSQYEISNLIVFLIPFSYSVFFIISLLFHRWYKNIYWKVRTRRTYTVHQYQYGNA